MDNLKGLLGVRKIADCGMRDRFMVKKGYE